jgi:hypothetical protein
MISSFPQLYSRSCLRRGREWLLLLIACIAPISATEIKWSSSTFVPVHPNPNPNQQSTGAALDQSFLFALGAFSSGFVPTSANVASWAANWSTLDRSTYAPTSRAFNSTATYESNTAPFTTTNQAYIWGYNGTCEAGEWILLTNSSWKFPIGSGGPSAPTVTWTVNGANAIILGSVNGGGYPGTPSAGFHIKTAAVGSALPPALPAASWQSLYFPNDLGNPAISGWNADPDVDGFSNLYEYATGSSPVFASSVQRLQLTRSTGGNSLFATLARDCRTSVIWSVKESSQLNQWTPAGPDITLSPDLSAGYRITLPISATSKRFVRFEFTVTP